MKLTTKSEYLLLALIYMARHDGDEFVRIEDICIEYRIPKKYLEQLFQLLKQNRVILTRRGTGGGYKLARPAAQISIAEIFRLTDGALAPTESVSKYFYAHTPLEKEEKIIAVLKDIRDYVAEKLEALSLADIL